jgi:hypothetical protein
MEETGQVIAKNHIPKGCRVLAYDNTPNVVHVGDTLRWGSYVEGEPDIALRKISIEDTRGEATLSIMCVMLVTRFGEMQLLIQARTTKGGCSRIL